jgi:membrane protein YqaA with SNARE-associated domain
MKRTLARKWYLIPVFLLIATLTTVYFYFSHPQNLGLVWLFLYIIPSNSFIPFPHEPAIIYYGKIYGPLITTITAVIPTIIACIIDYAILTPIFSHTKLSKLRETKIYQQTVYYFYKAPFLTNMFAAFSPVPFYPVRILSVASKYSIWKYCLAVTVGRIPRYYFLALFGMVLNIPNWLIGLFFLSFVSAEIYRRWSKRRKKGRPVLLEEKVFLDQSEVEKQKIINLSMTE